MITEYYPPVAFYFSVAFSGVNSKLDGMFQEASGMTIETGSETVTEGGITRFQWQLPTVNKPSNLVLKRGVLDRKSDLATWIQDTLSMGIEKEIKPKNLTVSLLGADNFPLMVWSFVNARPVKWQFSGLDSMKNEILTETLEFAYNYFEVTHKGSKSRDTFNNI